MSAPLRHCLLLCKIEDVPDKHELVGCPYIPWDILHCLDACALGYITSSFIVAAQLNAAYIDGQISWLTTNLAASTADYNIVIVRFIACIFHCMHPPLQQLPCYELWPEHLCVSSASSYVKAACAAAFQLVCCCNSHVLAIHQSMAAGYSNTCGEQMHYRRHADGICKREVIMCRAISPSSGPLRSTDMTRLARPLPPTQATSTPGRR